MRCPRLYLITDHEICARHGHGLHKVVRLAATAGVDAVQLREKFLPDSELAQLAEILLALLKPMGIPLFINDRVEVAQVVGAAGVHLGPQDMPVGAARRLLPHSMIGLSVETLDQLRAAENLPVDYLAISPLLATTSKADAAPPWGMEGLRQARSATSLPLIVIGGLHAGNVADAMLAGADGVAILSAICGAEDPYQATKDIVHSINSVSGKECDHHRA